MKNLKLKILSLSATIMICFIIIGVTVYSALKQETLLSNNITITSSGQTFVDVKVYEYLNENDIAVLQPPTEINFATTPIIHKNHQTNTLAGNISDILFSADGQTNYYAYKFVFENFSDVNVYANLSSSAINNDEISLYYGEELSSLSKVTNNTMLNSKINLDNNVKEFYLIIASDVDLINLNSKII